MFACMISAGLDTLGGDVRVIKTFVDGVLNTR
jgi:hypothetical protein